MRRVLCKMTLTAPRTTPSSFLAARPGTGQVPAEGALSLRRQDRGSTLKEQQNLTTPCQQEQGEHAWGGVPRALGQEHLYIQVDKRELINLRVLSCGAGLNALAGVKTL